MICLRCGYCCIQYDVIIVDDPDIGLVDDPDIAPEESNMKHKPNGVRCQHLVGEPGECSCAIHDRPWYNETPCWRFGQIESSVDTECRMGVHVLYPWRDCEGGLPTISEHPTSGEKEQETKMRYRIEVEAENEGELETILADGRWKAEVVPEPQRAVAIHVAGGTIHVDFIEGGGTVRSNLHRTQEEWIKEFGGDSLVAEYSRYEGGLDVLESFILSCAAAGINIESREFCEAIHTTLDGLDNS
jgi:Fe-S-cluster containining protein